MYNSVIEYENIHMLISTLVKYNSTFITLLWNVNFHWFSASFNIWICINYSNEHWKSPLIEETSSNHQVFSRTQNCLMKWISFTVNKYFLSYSLHLQSTDNSLLTLQFYPQRVIPFPQRSTTWYFIKNNQIKPK